MSLGRGTPIFPAKGSVMYGNVLFFRCDEDKSKHGGACFGSDPDYGAGLWGFCFLEYVQDPSNPTENCFEDAQWSKTAGRFWSSQACKEKAEGPPEIPLGY